MKSFLKVFKIPLIILCVLLVIGGTCKVITLKRPKIEFIRNNSECVTDERVFDYADKMTDAEEDSLRAKIAEVELLCGIDIMVVTLEESLEEYAKSYEPIIGSVEPYQYTMVFADNFYDEGAFGFDKPHGDGLILVDNWYREADGGVYSWVRTSGRVIEELDTDSIENILDLCLDYVEDDPAYAYEYFVELLAEYLDPNITLGDLLGGMFSVIFGFVVGIIFWIINLNGSKGKKTTETRTYVRGGMAEVREKQDIFLTKTVTRRKIETSNDSDSGSHTSAGGYSHGGGGHSR